MSRSLMRVGLATLASLVVLLVLNLATQPTEDALSAFPRGHPYYSDLVWYLDDIAGPTLFAATALCMLGQVFSRRQRRASLWPVVILALSYGAFAIGDSADLHWVFTAKANATDEVKSFGSFGTKVLTVLGMGFALIYAAPAMIPRALRAALFAFLVILVDMVMLSVSLEFAGYSFHVFEETVEVVAGLFLLLGVAPDALGNSAETTSTGNRL